jgi:hypothetical protein
MARKNKMTGEDWWIIALMSFAAIIWTLTIYLLRR